MRKSPFLALLLALVASALLASSAAAASLRVGVYDDYFSPKTKSITSGTKVIWTWKGDSLHNVRLATAPSGVKRSSFNSPTQTDGTFARYLKRTGKYRFLCTIHSNMIQTITVKSAS